MYHYIYDNYLADRKYHSAIAKIEARLTDLGINGKITKISVLKNLGDSLVDELSRNAKTIIIVGNSKTLNQSLNILKSFNKVYGLIPLGPGNELAELLGIPEGEAACNILSSRIIKPLYLGLINQNTYFLSYLELAGAGVNINCDGNYYINLEDKNDIVSVSNIYYGDNKDKINLNDNSGYLNLVVKSVKKKLFRKKQETFSYFKADQISLNSDRSVPILVADEKRIIKTPIKIEIAKEKLNLIVGKKRQLI